MFLSGVDRCMSILWPSSSNCTIGGLAIDPNLICLYDKDRDSCFTTDVLACRNQRVSCNGECQDIWDVTDQYYSRICVSDSAGHRCVDLNCGGLNTLEKDCSSIHNRCRWAGDSTGCVDSIGECQDFKPDSVTNECYSLETNFFPREYSNTCLPFGGSCRGCDGMFVFSGNACSSDGCYYDGDSYCVSKHPCTLVELGAVIPGECANVPYMEGASGLCAPNGRGGCKEKAVCESKKGYSFRECYHGDFALDYDGCFYSGFPSSRCVSTDPCAEIADASNETCQAGNDYRPYTCAFNGDTGFCYSIESRHCNRLQLTEKDPCPYFLDSNGTTEIICATNSEGTGCIRGTETTYY